VRPNGAGMQSYVSAFENRSFPQSRCVGEGDTIIYILSKMHRRTADRALESCFLAPTRHFVVLSTVWFLLIKKI
jgi:hypothetical protein